MKPRMAKLDELALKLDDVIAEAETQLAILRILAEFEPERRARIIGAVQSIVSADRLIPGVVEAFCYPPQAAKAKS